MDGTLQRRRSLVVTLLFLSGLVIILGIWLLESRLGLIGRVDRFAYPALAMLCAVMPILLRWLPHRRTLLELAAYGAVAAYVIINLLDIVTRAPGTAQYAAASQLQWLPLLYVAAFVLLDRRIARMAAGLVFGLSMLPLAVLLLGGRPADSALLMLLLNAHAVHFLILAALSFITTLNARYEDAAQRARRLEGVAATDALTGLANRRGMEQMLRRLAARPGHDVGLVLLDIDRFKSVNDSFGHLVGDELLAGAARRMRRALPDHARIGRWGGEEFLVVVPEGGADVPAIAERLRQAVSAEPHPVAGEVTISAGVAWWHSNQPLAAALRQADAALYEAKSLGRNRVILADPPAATELAGAA
ncbi:GGDEF domain-containing protein [Teichococcus oryzae]|uniref:diguanylate cyclase n=1 Tax=Teichococcus oryzae TaxID=1608942 RepID=A0A5B2TGR1_9PROT|nr:GGDEF domain-containing protein [Pseudoroseomonas oryzae]KAA2213088.1 GGDEF domain-containing protein [Pseudoroseomonas oryzae]